MQNQVEKKPFEHVSGRFIKIRAAITSYSAIMSTTAAKAKAIAKAASPIGTVSSKQIHGAKKDGYYYHYHAMKTTKKQVHEHSWYY